MNSQKIVIGVVKNETGKVLVSQRPEGSYLPGFWEFPGGKLEQGETFKHALRRELCEEIGIQVGCNYKLIEFKHQYDDRQLHFQVYIVLLNNTEAVANEKQKIKWVDQHKLSELNFPPANQSILDALDFPRAYMIADYAVFGKELTDIVRGQISHGIKLVQFRAPLLEKKQYISIAKELAHLCKDQNAKFIVNCDLDWSSDIKADGVHLNSQRLKSLYSEINTGANLNIYSTSCHSEQEIEYANELKVKATLIGPVQNTQSHPNSSPLGWVRFSQLCSRANMPVYAIGGVGIKDIPNALVRGAQGVAGIRDFMAN